ncbi:MAG: membrane integrity-associated transporter subunit PqiC [Alphaproteobacteria bacterium]|nr:membrane integrity-associated transporter subunit PqiC [Alphaproteobacteria bacterium]
MSQENKFQQVLAVAGLSLLVGACGPLISFGDDGPADTVYALRYDGGYPGTNSGPVVFVDEPTVAEGLKGEKVAVALDGNQLVTIDGVRWAAPVADLVRNYITRALGHQTDAQMVGDGGLDIKSACRLGAKIWAMEFVPGASARDDKVRVSIELSLVRMKDSMLLSKPTVAKTVTVGGKGDRAVMDAFNMAMSDVSAEMVSWFQASYRSCAEG